MRSIITIFYIVVLIEMHEKTGKFNEGRRLVGGFDSLKDNEVTLISFLLLFLSFYPFPSSSPSFFLLLTSRLLSEMVSHGASVQISLIRRCTSGVDCHERESCIRALCIPGKSCKKWVCK